MERLRLHGPDDLRIESRPDPVPGPHDVIIDTRACGICGTDLVYRRMGTLRPNGDPLPLGHEAAGVVAAVGSNVENIKPGMRVILNPMAKALDPARPVGATIGNGAAEGAFGHKFLVNDAQLGEDLLPIPDGVSFEEAAFTDPLGVALHAIYRGGARPGEKVVIYGAGPIGLAAILWLRRKGIDDIISIGRSGGRLNRALEVGARAVIDSSRENVVERLAELHGSSRYMGRDVVGTDLFIELAGGVGIVESAIAMGKYRSRIVLVGVHEEPEPISLQTVLLKEITITSAAGYPVELPEVVATLPELSEELKPIITHRYAFEKIHEAFATAGTPASSKVVVTF